MIKILVATAAIFLALASWWTYENHVARFGPHWVKGWRAPHMGVAIGHGREEYLMIDIPDGDCRHLIRHTSPHMESYYADASNAEEFLRKSGFCAR